MWTFEIITGKLYDASGAYTAQGYAGGNLGKNPEGKDNPADENVPDVGPLPEGMYTLGSPVEGTHMGIFAIPLIPDPSNNMVGRSGFFCHGDTTPPGNASEGCVVMPYVTRVRMWQSNDHRLSVVAKVQAG
jgi:hypothetical protein